MGGRFPDPALASSTGALMLCREQGRPGEPFTSARGGTLVGRTDRVVVLPLDKPPVAQQSFAERSNFDRMVAPRAQDFRAFMSNPISIAGAECVKAPTESIPAPASA